jgi:hypothetical protein
MMDEGSLLHEVESNAYKLRIAFLEETLRNYQSLPADPDCQWHGAALQIQHKYNSRF